VPVRERLRFGDERSTPVRQNPIALSMAPFSVAHSAAVLPLTPLTHLWYTALKAAGVLYGLWQAKGPRLDACISLEQGVQEDQASLIPLSDGGAACAAFWFGAVEEWSGKIKSVQRR
jgi:hypothetical protein